MGSGEQWAAILTAIRSPQVLVGWFALVLGVVAIAVIATAGLSESAKLLVLGGLGALFLILVVVILGGGVAEVARQVEQRAEQQHDLGATIAIAFSIRGHHSRWRTVGGIARDTGLSEETVRRHIEMHPEVYKQPIIRLGGTPIYGLRKPVA